MTHRLSTGSALPEGVGACQILTFQLGEETYGIDIMVVREIRAWTAVTRCPQSPAHVLGVLNLRGAVVPILDLRVRLDLETADFTPSTVIIVIVVDTPEGSVECGLVVDSVADVVDLEAAALRPAPFFADQERGDCIQGLAALGDRMVLLLSVERAVRADRVVGDPAHRYSANSHTNQTLKQSAS